MAYDSESDRVVLFGGRGPSVGNETWAYHINTNTWTQMSAIGPSPRFGHSMAYVPGLDRVILFGGYLRTTGNPPTNETWAYNLNADSWTQLAATNAPAPRGVPALVYDPALGYIVMFGGNTGVLNNETWTYDPQTMIWTQKNPVLRPAPRERFDMVYTPTLDRVVLFGGGGPSGLNNETWTYDVGNDAWRKMSPSLAPSPRSGHRMTYDTAADRVVLFGGNTGAPSNETWAYDAGADSWASLSPALAPAGRAVHRMAYDTESDRTVLFGGEWPFDGVASDETWAYDSHNTTWGALTFPLEPRSLAATAGVDRLDLTWQAPLSPVTTVGSAIIKYLIYRATASGPLSLLTAVGNTLAYTDVSVTNEITYRYQVTAVSAAGEGQRSNEVSATPPPPPDTTNPTITITTPTDGATLNSTSVTVKGMASDNVGVAKVEVSNDGTTWIAASGTTDWSGVLTTSEGANTVHARVTDTSGNRAESSISITVMLPPTTEPTGGLTPTTIALIVAIVAVGAGATVVVRRRVRRRPPMK